MKTAKHSSKNKSPNNTEGPTFPVNPRDLFDTFDQHTTWRRLFCAYFNSVPSIQTIYGVDCLKLARWMESSMDNRILKKISNERYNRRKRKMICEDFIYILCGDMMVYSDVSCDYLEILFLKNTPDAQALLISVKKCMRRAAVSNISLVVPDRDGFGLKECINKKPAVQLGKNYNDDLIPLHEEIIKTLRTKNSSGLVLFHGVPGTGKSTYIRFLATHIRKKIIFLSPRIAGNLDNPAFTRLLIEYPNSIIVIEDAEDLLVSRDTDKNSGISMLLNLTDGLLGATLGIQFICTFNTPVTNIDKALLRKGRLIALYEFGPLSTKKSQVLLNNLGSVDFMVTQPMTLADIYNVTKPEFQMEAKRSPIGFNTRVA